MEGDGRRTGHLFQSRFASVVLDDTRLKELLQVDTEEDPSELRRAEGTGRPLGAPEFVTGLERVLGRKIARRAPGRKAKTKTPTDDQLRLL